MFVSWIFCSGLMKMCIVCACPHLLFVRSIERRISIRINPYRYVCMFTANGRVVIDFTINGNRPNFVPDGMTIDAHGSLYVATFGASKVFKINPSTGAIELEIKIPAEQVTSVAFGGPNLDILYVTTAAKEFKSKQPPPAGKLFQVTGLGVEGRPMQSFKLNWSGMFDSPTNWKLLQAFRAKIKSNKHNWCRRDELLRCMHSQGMLIRVSVSQFFETLGIFLETTSGKLAFQMIL